MIRKGYCFWEWRSQKSIAETIPYRYLLICNIVEDVKKQDGKNTVELAPSTNSVRFKIYSDGSLVLEQSRLLAFDEYWDIFEVLRGFRPSVGFPYHNIGWLLDQINAIGYQDYSEMVYKPILGETFGDFDCI